MQLKDRVALITGGARGIGKEIAKLFVKEGARVALCDVNQEVLDSAVSEFGQNAAGYAADVTKLPAVEEMVNKILDKFGRIDILINNAGITRDALLVRMKEEDWDLVLSVNLKGTFNCTKSVLPVMMKARYGRIVSIASIIGIMGNAGQANYAASKAGIVALTKSVAKEVASRNINANAIAPGFIQTDMTAKLPEEIKAQMLKAIPQGRFGTPADIAEAALFLVSEQSGYITGQVVSVNGGMLM